MTKFGRLKIKTFPNVILNKASLWCRMIFILHYKKPVLIIKKTIIRRSVYYADSFLKLLSKLTARTTEKCSYLSSLANGYCFDTLFVMIGRFLYATSLIDMFYGSTISLLMRHHYFRNVIVSARRSKILNEKL